MDHRRDAGVSLLLVLATLLACKLPGGEKEKAPPAPAASAPPAVTPVAPAAPVPATLPTPSPGASASAGAATGKDYAVSGVAVVADDCKNAWAVLAAVPAAIHDKPEFFWRFARQVFLANPNFGYGIPEAPGEVVFFEGPHKPTGGVAVVAHCTSGVTCNQVAAAYKTVVPTSKPEVVCAKVPPTVEPGPTASVLEFDLTPGRGLHVPLDKNLPAKDDVVSQCVRLAACKAARDRRLDGDPAIECQKKPTGFKLACAAKKSCTEVLACTGE